MLWEQGDIDEQVTLGVFFFNLHDDKGWGDVEFDIHCDPLRSPLTPLVGLIKLRKHDIKLDTSQVTRFKNWRRATHDSCTWL